MTPAEVNYETYDLELLAIVACFKQWRHFLESPMEPIQVLTDHANLRGIRDVRQLNPRQARWATFLARFDFIVQHRPGASNPADPASRRPDYVQTNQMVTQLLPTFQKKLTALQSGEMPARVYRTWIAREPPLEMSGPRDPTTSEMLEDDSETLLQIDRGTDQSCLDPTAGAAGCKQLVPRSLVAVATSGETAYGEPSTDIVDLIRSLQQKDERAIRKRSQLLAKPRTGRSQRWAVDSSDILMRDACVYVPDEPSVRQELLKVYHDDPLAGHFGGKRTLELLQRSYYWPSMDEDVQAYVKTCDVCQRTKTA